MTEDERKGIQKEVADLLEKHGIVDFAWVGINLMGEAIGRHRCGSEGASVANGDRKDRLVGLLGQIQWDLHDRYDTRPWEKD